MVKSSFLVPLVRTLWSNFDHVFWLQLA